VINDRLTGEYMASASQMNQPSPDSYSLPQEQEQNRESATDLWLGADATQRRALAARVVQQWQQEAEHLMAQRHYRRAIEVYTRIVVVNPEHVQALQGRAQVYRQVGMEQAAALDECTLQALLVPKQSREEFSLGDCSAGIAETSEPTQ
jgi:hypothetical protein